MKVIEEPLANFRFDQKPWHVMTPAELFTLLQSRPSGLTSIEAEKRRLDFGPNLITPPKKMHWFLKFLIAFFGGFQLMLIGGSVLCFTLYGLSEGTDMQTLALAIVLIVIVLVTTCF